MSIVCPTCPLDFYHFPSVILVPLSPLHKGTIVSAPSPLLFEVLHVTCLHVVLGNYQQRSLTFFCLCPGISYPKSSATQSSKSFFLALSLLMISWKFWVKSLSMVSQIHSSISLPPVCIWRSSCADIFLIQRCIFGPLRYPKKSMAHCMGLFITLVCLLIPW